MEGYIESENISIEESMLHVSVACFVGILAGLWVVAFNAFLAFAFALELIAAVKRVKAGCLYVHLELQRGQIARLR